MKYKRWIALITAICTIVAIIPSQAMAIFQDEFIQAVESDELDSITSISPVVPVDKSVMCQENAEHVAAKDRINVSQSVLSEKSTVAELSEVECNKLCGELQIDKQNLVYFAEQGYGLASAALCAAIVKDTGLDEAQVLQITSGCSLIEVARLGGQLSSFKVFTANKNITEAESKAIVQMLENGHSTENVAWAYSLADSAGTALKSAVAAEGRIYTLFDLSDFYDVSEEEKQIVIDICNEHRLNAPLMMSYLRESGITAKQYTVKTQEAVRKALSDQTQTVQAASVTEPEKPDKYITAPFSYLQGKNEEISLNTGSLIRSETDLTLPGKNGFDLNIVRRYDSSAANIYNPDVIRNYDCYYTYGYTTNAGSIMIPGTMPQDPIQPVTESIENEYRQAMDLIDLDTSNSGLFMLHASGYYIYNAIKSALDADLNRRYISFFPGSTNQTVNIILIQCESIDLSEWEFTGYDQTKSPNNSFYDSRYGIGFGWTFAFSSVETDGNTKYLHTADGQRYQVNITSTAGDSNLKDYTLTDLRLEQASGGYQGAAYVLYYKDGKQEYFDNSGKIICAEDRYGNRIAYAYTGSGNTSALTITDTLGRVVTISNETVDGQQVKVLTAPDGSRTVYSFSTVSEKNVLSSVADAEGRITTYAYQPQNGTFSIFSKSAGLTNTFINLTEVGYPTGGKTIYNYEQVSRNLGSSGYQQEFRIISRKEVNAQNAIFNEDTYTYAGDYSGWGTCNDPQNLPSGFTYGITVTETGGVISEYTFNSKHLKTNKKVKENDVTVQSFAYTYNTDKLPVSETVTAYENGDSLTTVSQYTYDNKGNILTYLSPKAEGSNADYTVTMTYASDYSMQLTKSYKTSSGVTLLERNTLTADKKSIAMSEQLENDTLTAKTEYTYDSFGNVTESRVYTDLSDSTACIVTTYDYSDNVTARSGQFNGGYLTAQRRMGIKDVAGNLVNGTGILEETYIYDVMGYMVSAEDANGGITAVTRDALGRVTSVTKPGGTQTVYTYDDIQNRQTVTVQTTDSSPRVLNQIQYTYDVFGNTVSATDMVTQRVLNSCEYDGRMQLTAESNAAGLPTSKRTEYTLDLQGRRTAIAVKNGAGEAVYTENVEYLDATAGGLSKVTHTVLGEAGAPDLITVAYVNKYGELVQEGQVSGGSDLLTSKYYAYDYTGRKISESVRMPDGNGGYTERVLRTVSYNAQGKTTGETDAAGETAAFAYDAAGRLLSSTDKAGTVTTYLYDAAGRLLQESTPMAEAQTSVKQYWYDGNGNVTRTTQTDGADISYGYDADNHLLLVSAANGTVTEYTVYAYDPMGNLTDQYTGLSTPADMTGASHTQYAYDHMGRQTLMTDALGAAESTAYDLNGFAISRTDRNGVTTAYTYDALGNLLGESAGSLSKTRAYYATGALKSETSDGISLEYVYDDRGLLSGMTETGNVVKNYTYDNLGSRASFTLQVSGETKLNTTYTYDVMNRLHQVYEGGSLTAAYAYDTNGNRQSLTYGNGAVESYAYNLANLVTQVENRDGQGALLSSYAYTYDLSGNQVGKTDHTGRNTAYTYDGLGRLTDETETLNGQTVFSAAYAYDLRGNRTQLTVGGTESYTTSYTYDLNNRLLTETKNAGTEGELREYHYDANGNTLSVSVGAPAGNGQGFAATLTGGGAVAYTYDSFNRMTAVENGDGIHTYAYRPDGLRQSKTVGGVTTTHIWDGQNIAAEQENGAVTAVYIRGVNLLAREDNTGARQYYLYNAHGDVTQLTNEAGSLVRAYDYDAFGNQRALEGDPGTDGNPFRYCGEYWDNETGTYYLRARYYDPAVGRFIAEDTHWNPGNSIYGDNPVKINERKDPLGMNIYTYVPDVNAIRQSGNLYAYGLDNPVMYQDPTGEAVINVIFAAIGAIAGWVFGDYVASNLGLEGWKYWAVRGAVTVGGAAIGWFAGTVISKVVASFLKANPGVVFKLACSMGPKGFVSAMEFLGINPFTIASDSGKFIGIIKDVFNTPTVQIGLDWAKTLIQRAQNLGYSVRLDAGHAGTIWNGWHLNIGKYHIAVDPSIVDELKSILEG